MMRSVVKLAGIFLLMFALYLQAEGAQISQRLFKVREGKPVVRFEHTDFDFGTAKKGEVVKHDFVFVNEGSSVLKILDLVRS